MRTTLTLDPDVSERLRQRMRAGKRSLKETVNEALRTGLGLNAGAKEKRFRVKPHASPFVPGVDPEKLHQLVDEMEAEVTRSGPQG